MVLGLEPEQMAVVNPILILILLPLFDRVIYPAVRKWYIIHEICLCIRICC